MKNSKLIYYGIAQSLGVFIYTMTVVWFLFNGERFIGKSNSIWMPLAILMLFVVSAAVTGSIVFGRSVYLYLNGLKKEAVKLFIYTVLSLVSIIITIFIANIIW